MPNPYLGTRIFRNQTGAAPDPDATAPLATVGEGVASYKDTGATDGTYHYWLCHVYVDDAGAVPGPLTGPITVQIPAVRNVTTSYVQGSSGTVHFNVNEITESVQIRYRLSGGAWQTTTRDVVPGGTGYSHTVSTGSGGGTVEWELTPYTGNSLTGSTGPTQYAMEHVPGTDGPL